ncbi:MAG: Rid family detoxifying hydrolase [Oscillospiraceae bacterium]|jgi:2-iminobutanoate/2-iminopropanoate deaminase|nr:Rid family detoxifying hydrolase [Oscillospiraceae bacterium]
MALKRFFTEEGPKAVGPYCTAVIAGDTVYCSGMLGLDSSTGKLVEGGVESQAAQALANLQLVATELGLTMADVAKTIVYLADMADFGAVNALYRQAFGLEYPARTCVAVAALPLGALIEIDVTFVKPTDETPSDL